MEIILKYFADFSATQVAQFTALEALYKEWNEKINVISRKDIDSLYEKTCAALVIYSCHLQL